MKYLGLICVAALLGASGPAQAVHYDLRPASPYAVRASGGTVIGYQLVPFTFGNEAPHEVGELKLRDDVSGADQVYFIAGTMRVDDAYGCPSGTAEKKAAPGTIIPPTFTQGWDATGRYDWACTAKQFHIAAGTRLILVYWSAATRFGRDTRFTDAAWTVRAPR